MTVGELIEKLRDYPRDMEVVMTRVFDGAVDGNIYDVDKTRMKEITSDDERTWIATDADFDADRLTTNVVVLYPAACQFNPKDVECAPCSISPRKI